MTFYNIQPIDIKDTSLLNLLSLKIDKSTLLDNIDNKLPYWLNQFNNTNMKPLLNLLHIKTNPSFNDFNSLKKCLNPINNIDIQHNLNLNDSQFYILYNPHLKYFIITFHLVFDFNESELLSLINGKDNIYHYIRNLFSKDTDDSIISNWGIDIQKKSIDTIFNILKSFDNNILLSDISILNNSCNITNVVTGHINQNIINLLEINNNNAERLNSSFSYLDVNSDKYLFKGRYHTIISSDSNQFRYIPIQFYLQFMWFYLIKINSLISISDDIILSDHKSDNHLLLIKHVYQNIKYLLSSNPIFKSSIEADAQNIYSIIEQRWNIENLLSQIKPHLSDLNNYIHNYKNSEKKSLLDRINLLEQEKLELKSKSEIDNLTRAFLRNKFEQDIKSIFDSDFKFLTLGFLDADFFKLVNDDYGHQAGDEVLKILVDTVYQIIRTSNIDAKVYRYGGEEFLLIIQNQNHEKSIQFLEQIRNKIENIAIEHDDQIINFTISIGVSFFQNDDNIDSLIKRADDNVYLAKKNGRNRIEF